MASLTLSVPLDLFDSKKSTFLTNPLQPFTGWSILAGSSCTQLGRLSTVKVSRIGTEFPKNDTLFASVDELVDGSVSGSLVEEDIGFKVAVKKKHWRGKKRSKRKPGLVSKFGRTGREIEGLFVYGGEMDVNYSTIRHNLSLEVYNFILKQLERCGGDDKTLRFFEWMRRNGKLEDNVCAYNVVLRVLGRRKDWNSAERLIMEANGSLGSGLDFRVFNTLIYACTKRGHVELARKWFRMMLDVKVQPNVATFGMLMGLYQKGWNVEEAEFTFSKMRSYGIVCESAYSAMITIYTRLGLYEKAEEVIRLMNEDNVVLNLENWLVSINAYCQRGKLEVAEQLVVSMQEAGFAPDVVVYNMLITGYGKISDMAAAQRVFLSIEHSGLKPDETTFRSMIEGWGRNGNYKEAEWCYEELKCLGFKPNSSNLHTLINLQAENGDEEGAFRTLEDMVQMGCHYSSILGMLLKAYERAGSVDKIPFILKGPFYQHVLVNQTSCSILVMAYVKHRLVDEAIKVLGEKSWTDLVFEDNLYHLVLCSCKELGHLEDAVKIYTNIPGLDHRPNLHILCTMIDIYSIMGMFGEGEKIYVRLKSSGVVLDVIAFSIVVRMYVKAGSLKDACAVLELMENCDIVPDVYLFRDMFRIYQRCGMTHKLRDLYYKFSRSGIEWDQEMYNCVINCCARALPVDELSELFNEMLQRGFAPSVITFNVMLDVCGKSKLFKKAREVFAMASKRGLVDVISYNTIVAAYGETKDLENMAETVRLMQFDGFSVSLEAYNCMLDAYGKVGQMERFRNVLQRMKDSKCSSDHYTYNIMINIYGERGWIDEVATVLNELRKYGTGPDLCSYNTLIKAYGIAGMVEEAVGLVKEMREKGIEPDKITYTNLITALRKNDEYLEAVKWSLWMKQMGI